MIIYITSLDARRIGAETHTILFGLAYVFPMHIALSGNHHAPIHELGNSLYSSAANMSWRKLICTKIYEALKLNDLQDVTVISLPIEEQNHQVIHSYFIVHSAWNWSFVLTFVTNNLWLGCSANHELYIQSFLVHTSFRSGGHLGAVCIRTQCNTLSHSTVKLTSLFGASNLAVCSVHTADKETSSF